MGNYLISIGITILWLPIDFRQILKTLNSCHAEVKYPSTFLKGALQQVSSIAVLRSHCNKCGEISAKNSAGSLVGAPVVISAQAQIVWAFTA